MTTTKTLYYYNLFITIATMDVNGEHEETGIIKVKINTFFKKFSFMFNNAMLV